MAVTMSASTDATTGAKIFTTPLFFLAAAEVYYRRY